MKKAAEIPLNRYHGIVGWTVGRRVHVGGIMKVFFENFTAFCLTMMFCVVMARWVV